MTGLDALIVVPDAAQARLRGLPLALWPLLGRPLVAHAVVAARAAGAARVTVVDTGGGLEGAAFAEALAEHEVRLHTHVPGHAAAGASDVAGEGAARIGPAGLSAALEASAAGTVLVLDGGAPLVRAESLRQLLRVHSSERAAATRLVGSGGDSGAGACVCVFERLAAARALPAADGPSTSGDQDLSALFAALAEGGSVVASAAAGDPDELGLVTSAAGLAAAAAALRDRRNRELMAAGVVIEDPASTWIGADVVVEPGARLRPSCVLEGRTMLAAGAEVGPFVRLVDVSLGAGAQVLDHCLLRQCVVEDGALVGPFAHIRPESRVRRRAKVGNFVELKNTDLGEGSKAPHLSYLGDASIGAQVNVGAGTITCNYDGERKYPTRIGERAFIGSDAILVAPVRVGAGAYVAAGSTITADVPADALALGRARQVVKEGWAARRRRAREAARKS